MNARVFIDEQIQIYREAGRSVGVLNVDLHDTGQVSQNMGLAEVLEELIARGAELLAVTAFGAALPPTLASQKPVVVMRHRVIYTIPSSSLEVDSKKAEENFDALGRELG